MLVNINTYMWICRFIQSKDDNLYFIWKEGKIKNNNINNFLKLYTVVKLFAAPTSYIRQNKVQNITNVLGIH